MIVLDRKIPFVSAALDRRLDDAVAILREAEQQHGLRWIKLPVNADEYNNMDEWYESHLWPFLSATHFLLAGDDLFGNDWALTDDMGIDHTPTWRQWGWHVADWANRNWFTRPSSIGKTEWLRAQRPGEYLDFYMADYISDLIEGYSTWRDAVLQILDAKEKGGTCS